MKYCWPTLGPIHLIATSPLSLIKSVMYMIDPVLETNAKVPGKGTGKTGQLASAGK